jgi:hypothetical protein
MLLKPQDILVLLKIASLNTDWSFRSLASGLSMSVGEVHNALGRAERAQLFDAKRKRPRTQALLEFLVHGIKYAFPAERGTITRGIPTSFAAAPLNEIIVSEEELPPVWPSPHGTVRGYSVEPLFSSVPDAIKNDPRLYELLSLVDAIRDGRARERKMAAEILTQHLKN